MNVRPLLVLAALAVATRPDWCKGALDDAKGAIRRTFASDPMGSVLTTVTLAAWAFYRAEREHNPKVQSFQDALVYVATNLSVGYCDVLAMTPKGKLIGSLLMIYGPAMAAQILDPPSTDAASERSEIVDRLDRILRAIDARPTPNTTGLAPVIVRI